MYPTTPTNPGASITPTNLNGMAQNAASASANANSLDTSAPGLLTQLKQNLVGIFSQNNPILNARNDALSNYLATPNQVRSDILTPNLPEVQPGRQLTLSPTQQAAIVSGRQAAALAPLAGWNEIAKGMYGTIGDMVANAGNIYSAQTQGADRAAQNAMDLYKSAIEQYNAQTARISAGNNAPLSASLVDALLKQMGYGGTTPAGATGAQPAQSLGQIFTNNVPNAQAIPVPTNDLQLGNTPQVLPGTPDWLTAAIAARNPQPSLQNVNLQNPYMTPSTGGISLGGGASPLMGYNISLH